MNAIQALVILLAIFAFGEMIADKTKALISTTLVIAVVLLIGFWCGLPADIFDTSALSGIAFVLIGPLITHLGTMMDFAELKRQWKTVLIGFVCVVISVAAIIVICPLIINRDMAIAGAPIFAGANVAALVMTQALTEKGLAELSSFVILMLITQNFIGIPVASVLLRKEARRFISTPESIKLYAKAVEKNVENKGNKRKPLQLPESFNKPSVEMLKLSIIAAFANFISGLTGGTLHYFVAALLVGVIFAELGFLKKHSLNHTASSGFVIFCTTMIIFSNLAKTTPQQMLSMLFPLIISLGIGVLATCLSGYVIGKALKVSPLLAIPLGLTCTFGFPTTMLMSKEVASAMGQTEEEKAVIENHILPKMITAGFVTVTIVSVIVAGIVANIL